MRLARNGFAGLALAAALAAGCRQQPARPVTENWTVMNTFAGVSVPGADAARLPAAAAEAQAVFQRLEGAFSVFHPGSDLARLNRAGAGVAVPLSDPTRAVLGLALEYARATEGRFDPTVGPLMEVWGFHGAPVPERPPDDARLQSILQRVGYRHLNLSNGVASLGREGMGVDLGGIGKGYAVDECYAALVAAGFSNLLVNLGGNIRCAGSADGSRPWRVGVRHPLNRGEILGHLDLTGGLAVATSGQYENFIEIGGVRYGHILSPFTGRPVEGVAGVTVLAPTAAQTDALSTALLVAGLNDGPRVLSQFAGADALLVPQEPPLRILVTAGFARRFTPAAGLAAAVSILPATP